MRNLTTILFTLLFINNLNSQLQIGQAILGELAQDRFGRSISMSDQNTIAVGAYKKDDNGLDAGQVSILKWNGNSWIQKGNKINGDNAGDYFGYSVAMPDSNTFAAGAYHGDTSGIVKVFNWNGVSWEQKGGDIIGISNYENAGWAISMPDPNTIAIGAPNHDNFWDAAGSVRIFSWNGIEWIQKGLEINGLDQDDHSGYSLDMPNSNTIAISSPDDDTNGSNTGLVKIFDYDGINWIQRGLSIYGTSDGDEFGLFLSMPDINTIAIGTPYHNGVSSNSGIVRIYTWNGNSWSQKGGDIEGEENGEFSGVVSMPNSNLIAVGAYGAWGGEFNINGISGAGRVRIYKYIDNSWSQIGEDIDGTNAYDFSGISVSMPDSNTVAIGSELNDTNGESSGQVRIFNISALTGLKYIYKKEYIHFFPNPNNGIFTVNEENVLNIKVYSIDGKQIQSKSEVLNEKSIIEINSLKGIYFVELTYKDKSTSIFKILVN